MKAKPRRFCEKFSTETESLKFNEWKLKIILWAQIKRILLMHEAMQAEWSLARLGSSLE